MKIIILTAVLAVALAMVSSANDVPAPPDVAAPPEDATCTDSGLASKVLNAGTGTEHPAAGTRSRSTTRAGPPTARCSTAR